MGPCHLVAFLQNRRRAVEMADVFDEFEADRQVEALHGPLDPRNERGAGAEFIHAQPEQQRREENIAGHFAAHPHPEIVRMRRHRRSCE